MNEVKQVEYVKTKKQITLIVKEIQNTTIDKYR